MIVSRASPSRTGMKRASGSMPVERALHGATVPQRGDPARLPLLREGGVRNEVPSASLRKPCMRLRDHSTGLIHRGVPMGCRQ